MKFLKLVRDDYKQVTLQLSNGSCLKSKFVYGKGSFWRHYHLVHPLQPKMQMPLVSGFSSGSTLHVGVIDVDILPPGFASFEQVIDALLDLPGVMACKSPSGRAKGFFVFSWHNHHPDIQHVVARLKSILPDNLRNYFDTKGVSRFFLSAEVAECLKDLASASFFDWSKGEENSNIVPIAPNTIESFNFTYHQVEEKDIPASFEPFINRKGRGWERRVKFCQIILAMYGLANEDGFSLPQSTIGAQVGADSAVVSDWLKWFRDAGLLQKVSNSYIVGLKAIKYTAHGELLESIIERKKQTSYSITLPKQLPTDGNYYGYLLSLSKKLPNWIDYKTVVASLPGIQYKNRYKMAEKIFIHDRSKERKT